MAGFDFGRMATGAGTGATMGSTFGPLGTAIGGLAGGLFGGFMGNAGEQQGQGPTQQIHYAQDYPWFGGAQSGLADFSLGILDRISQGGYSPQFEALAPQLRGDAMRDLSQAYMGVPGMGGGIMGQQLGLDIGRGFGGRDAGTSRQRSALGTQWGQQARDIGTYMAGLGYQDMNQSRQLASQNILNLKQGPRFAMGNVMPGQGSQPGFFDQMVGMAGAVTPWLQGGGADMFKGGMSSIGNWFGGGGGGTQTVGNIGQSVFDLNRPGATGQSMFNPNASGSIYGGGAGSGGAGSGGTDWFGSNNSGSVFQPGMFEGMGSRIGGRVNSWMDQAADWMSNAQSAYGGGR